MLSCDRDSVNGTHAAEYCKSRNAWRKTDAVSRSRQRNQHVPSVMFGIILRVISVIADALLFDMDGVLIDSTPAVARVWARWATEHGFDPVATARRAQGRPSITTIRELLPETDPEVENWKVEQQEMEDLEGVVSLPGALERLSQLPHDRWAVVTSATPPLAELRVRVAGLPQPQVFITSNDVLYGKPHPEPYRKAAAVLSFSPPRCMVLEDSPAGMQAGKAAGARVIALRTTVLEADLVKARPDWIVDDCRAVALRLVGAGSPLEITID